MITRRNLVSGAAWAVPVVVTGMAAPKVAASGPIVITPSALAGCKEPGKSQTYDWGYHLPWTVQSSVDGLLTIVGVSAPGDPGAVVLGGGPFAVTAGLPLEIDVVIGASNSANGTAILTYSFNGFAGTTQAVSFSGFNPCKK